MNRRERRLVIVAVVLGVLGGAGSLGWAVGSGRLNGARTEFLRKTDLYRRVLLTVREERLERPALDERLGEVVDRSLGGELESVDSDLRRRLAMLAESAGVRGASVSTVGAAVIATPAAREFSRSGNERAFRDEPDFVVVRANVKGVGTIDAAVRFLHELDAAPWLKRIEQVRFDPDREGKSIGIAVGVATLFLPGLAGDGELDQRPPSSRRPGSRYDSLVAANPFSLPEPPVTPSRATSPPKVLVAPKNPRAAWKLTGIMEGPDGTEAWLRQLETGETIELLVSVQREIGGQIVLQLDAASGDVASFRVGEETFRVLVGSTLDHPLP
ncbi:MAG: hypothetical protein P8J59_05355 [Phycisphaerales bacterium]|nr:hypothetical protein [Phycisphaerales bacterium]